MSITRLIWLLAVGGVACVLVEVIYFVITPNAPIPGWYAGFALIVGAVMVLGAHLLRFLIGRDENFYGRETIETPDEGKIL